MGTMHNSSNVVDVRIDDDPWHDPQLDAEAVIRAAVRATLAVCGMDAASTGVSVLLTSDVGMAQLNARWRGRDGPTNVLSFPAAAGQPGHGDGCLGDIALGFGILAREAAENGTPLVDHVSHMTVHGVLHLLGYDHGTEAEAERMERRETAVLRDLLIEDPYSGTETRCSAM